MRIPILVMAALALAGCASTGGGKPAVCDGKHLRPANPYGTVLAPSTSGAAPTAVGSNDAKPKTLSSNASAASFGSC
jgi:hypothetical protein